MHPERSIVFRYTFSLQALSHALLLAPQNPFYMLQAAETAYTAGDIPLSFKMFLMTVDMTDDDSQAPVKDSIPIGITVRAWYGVRLVRRASNVHFVWSLTHWTVCSALHK